MIKCQTCQLSDYSLIKWKPAPEPDRFWVVFYTIVWITKDISSEVVRNQIRIWSDQVEKDINPIRLVYTDDIEKAKVVHSFSWYKPFPHWEDSLAYVPNQWKYQHYVFYRQDQDDFLDREITHELDVVCHHELRHVFSVDHNTIESNSIMAPYYNRNWVSTELDKSIIRRKMESYIEKFSSVPSTRFRLLNIVKRYKNQFMRLNEEIIDKVLDIMAIEYDKSMTKREKILLVVQLPNANS